MTLFLPFFFGFLSAVVGVIPPGLINMTAAKVSLTDGKKRAMMFVLGALIIIVFQTYISVIFAHYIDEHQEVVIMLREIGLFIFIALTVYFLKFAKKPKINDDAVRVKSKRSRFFMGMVISAINFFPIPYYVLISIALASYNVFTFETWPIYSLVFGVVLGSFSVFYFYVVFFNKMKSKSSFFINNMNKMIGIITGFVALLTLFNIVKYYF
ncbi:LysE family transporter [Flavobacterium sp. SUN052]|uniref:LysE family transporter n=1 Tax=Flavobacterium sp. SUN052 TaxID=3002441 RepID=UPI00237D88F0|nr:LysE family transporter [Flavobacterium sp. SUN052]MEC4004042.1 LysE family transporter [Flavobacterium sp. SUN052]